MFSHPSVQNERSSLNCDDCISLNRLFIKNVIESIFISTALLSSQLSIWIPNVNKIDTSTLFSTMVVSKKNKDIKFTSHNSMKYFAQLEYIHCICKKT